MRDFIILFLKFLIFLFSEIKSLKKKADNVIDHIFMQLWRKFSHYSYYTAKMNQLLPFPALQSYKSVAQNSVMI